MKLNRSGFSLLEIVITVAVLGVVVSMAIPNLLAWSANHRLRVDFSQLEGDLQVARLTAINQSTAVTLLFNQPAANQYTVFIDDGSGGGIARDLIQNGTEEVVFQGQLSQGVSFSTINSSGNAILFNGRGLRSRPVIDPASLILTNSEGRQYQIFITMVGDVNGDYL
jgi:type IV fimbrial biogenesis protein FimT